MSRHYEAVVIGGGLSAVVTAALLAKRGVRGLLIDEGELASEDPHMLFDSVHADVGSEVMLLIHRELGLQDELRNRSGPVDPLVQIVWPEERLDLSDDPARCLREVQRAFGSRADGVEGFFERLQAASEMVGQFLATSGELPASGYFTRRSARSQARRFEPITRAVKDSDLFADLDPSMVELFTGPSNYLTYVDDRTADEASVARFVRPLARLLLGTRSLRSARTLRGLFVAVAQRRAFELQTGALAAAEPKGRQVLLRLVGQAETITAEAIVDATADLSALSVLPIQKRKKDLSETMQTVKPRSKHYALGIELDEAVIPPGMGQHLILLNGHRESSHADSDPGDRPLWVTTRPGKQAGRTQLVVSHPVSAARAHSEGMDALEAMMRSRIERVIPFFRQGRPETRPLSDRGGAPGVSGRAMRPVLNHPLLEPDLDAQTGLTGVPCRTSLKNVFIAGPTVLPGLGIEGEYFAALQAADACEALLKGTKPKRGMAQR